MKANDRYQEHPHQEEEREKEAQGRAEGIGRELEGNYTIKAKEGGSFIKILVHSIQCCRERCRERCGYFSV